MAPRPAAAAAKTAAKPSEKPADKAQESGRLFEVPQPKITLLQSVADNFDPEEIRIGITGTLRFTANAQKPVEFVNGCRPGRLRRIVIDTIVTREGALAARTGKDGEIQHGLAVALKVESIDFDADPLAGTHTAELQGLVKAIAEAHAGKKTAELAARIAELSELVGPGLPEGKPKA